MVLGTEPGMHCSGQEYGRHWGMFSFFFGLGSAAPNTQLQDGLLDIHGVPLRSKPSVTKLQALCVLQRPGTQQTLQPRQHRARQNG